MEIFKTRHATRGICCNIVLGLGLTRHCPRVRVANAEPASTGFRGFRKIVRFQSIAIEGYSAIISRSEGKLEAAETLLASNTGEAGFGERLLLFAARSRSASASSLTH